MATPAQNVLLFGQSRPLALFDFQTGRNQIGTQTASSPSDLPGWSFTRASTGTALNAAGAVLAFASGQPRITDLGLLVEESRTNLSVRSQDFANAAWSKNLAAATASGISAPDGTTTGQTLTASAGAGFHGVFQAITLSGATAYAYTAYVKQGAARYAYLNIGSTSGNFITAVYDLQTATVTQTGSGGTSGTITSTSATPLAGGWVAITLIGSLVTVTGSYVEMGIANAATGNSMDGFGQVTFTAAGTETLSTWGTQVEAGAFATSYIPTTSAIATRAADALTLTYAGSPTTATVTYGASSTASPSAASPLNLGASSGGAWVNNYIRRVVVR